jgi:hypothetical protein
MSGKFLLIYICNFHVLSHLLLNYIYKLHWNISPKVSHNIEGSIKRVLGSVKVVGNELARTYRQIESTAFKHNVAAREIFDSVFQELKELLVVCEKASSRRATRHRSEFDFYCPEYMSHVYNVNIHRITSPSGKFLLIYICNFHVLSNLLLIYICKLLWNLGLSLRRI